MAAVAVKKRAIVRLAKVARRRAAKSRIEIEVDSSYVTGEVMTLLGGDTKAGQPG